VDSVYAGARSNTGVARKPGRFRTLRQELERLRPDLDDLDEAIASGHVLVNGVPSTNPNTGVAAGTSIVFREPKVFRGLTKLRGALQAFDVDARGGVALDAGASAGGFVQAWLEAGARRVYAVEVGYGQLLGSLRQDSRVVNLERTNIGELDRDKVPDAVDLISLDLGFLSLATGVPQLGRLELVRGADLLALVKPTAELGLPSPPEDEPSIREAVERASAAVTEAGWEVLQAVESPIRGSRGAVEWFLHGRRV
jgi:23S rRNA (cytidine1920-2'-O)/16S rRNA (cytidine1409-2'-O)-methyltransferase